MVMVRCGSCRSQFDVPGPGRFQCPTCAAVNQVGAPPPGAENESMPEGPPPEPAGHATCGECSFSFRVGAIDVATCPNCNAPVVVGRGQDNDE